MSRLSPDQIALQLESLPNWHLDGHSLTKTFEFDDFASVMAFMVRVAFYVEQLEHYPVWQNSFTTLSVRIGDVEQIELYSRDIQLAKRIESVYQAHSPSN